MGQKLPILPSFEFLREPDERIIEKRYKNIKIESGNVALVSEGRSSRSSLENNYVLAILMPFKF